MFGRVLFAFIWLIIAAGVALPLYPNEAPTSAVAVSDDPVQLAAGSDVFGCEDCAVAGGGRAACRSDCACDDAQPASVPLKHPVSVTIVVRSHAPQPPPDLPTKLPAI
jgi:hypothetical protein